MSIEGKDIVKACKRQPLLAVCIALCLALGGSLYLRSGLLDETQALLDEQSKLQRKLAANVKNGTKLDEQTASLKKVNELIRSNALKEGDLAANQQLFLRLETETNVKLVDLRPLPIPPPAKGAPAKGYVPMAFSLSVSGPYRNIMEFLKRLESGLTLAKVTQASAAFSSSPDAEQTLALTVEVLGVRQ